MEQTSTPLIMDRCDSECCIDFLVDPVYIDIPDVIFGLADRNTQESLSGLYLVFSFEYVRVHNHIVIEIHLGVLGIIVLR